MTQMLYKSPGKHDWPQHGGTFEYIVVDEVDIDQAVLDGWSMTTMEALAAMKLQIGDTVTFINDDTSVVTPMTVTEVYEGPTANYLMPKMTMDEINQLGDISWDILDENVPFDGMELAPRTITALAKNGITVTKQLRALSDEQLLAMNGIGKSVVADINEGFELMQRRVDGLD